MYALFTVFVAAAGAYILLTILLNFKTSRPDGTLINKFSIHAYRTMLGYIMPTRNEAVVYFDSFVRVEKLLDYLEKAGPAIGANVIHCLLGAITSATESNPKMNLFVSGYRLYQRKGWYATFSMKRKKGRADAKVSAVKLKLDNAESFKSLCERINGDIKVERSDAETYSDKETGLLIKLPRPLMRLACKLVRWADYYNILPASFIKGDGFYTSFVIANLGSVGMGAAYHHLYEWGNCPLFLMIGKIEDRPMVENGVVVARKVLHIRYSYDERIDDGLTARHGIDGIKNALEHPFETFGCIAPDGSDVFPLKGWPGIELPDRAPPPDWRPSAASPPPDPTQAE